MLGRSGEATAASHFLSHQFGVLEASRWGGPVDIGAALGLCHAGRYTARVVAESCLVPVSGCIPRSAKLTALRWVFSDGLWRRYYDRACTSQAQG